MIQRLVDSLHFGECDCCNGSFRLYTWENGSFCSKCLIDNGVFDEREERDFMCDFLHNFDSKLNVPTLSNVLSTIHHGKCLSCSSAWSRLYAWHNGSFCAECLISSGAINGKNIDIIRKFDEKQNEQDTVEMLLYTLHNGKCVCCNKHTRLYTWLNGAFCASCLVNNGVFDNWDGPDRDDLLKFDEEEMSEECHMDAGG